jgi:hypothetical protein
MEFDLIKDLNSLTTIPESSLSKLLDISNWDICNCVEETTLQKDNLAKIDLGLGTLMILMEEDNIRYKFIPSRELEVNIKNTYLKKENPLKNNLEKSLVKKITEIYKEFL